MRHRAVATGAPHLDGEGVGRGHGRPGAHLDLADRLLGREVQTVDLIHPRVVERARLDHRARAAQHFLGGLEEEDGRPGHLRAPRGQDVRHRDRDRGVAVVPARVHHARRAGGEGRLEQLGERQRVDVGAPRDGRSGPVTVEHAHHAGAADAGPHIQLRRVQALRDDLRGAPLLVAQLGMAVEVAAERHQIVRALGDLLAPFRAGLAHPGVSWGGSFFAVPMLRRRRPRCQPSRSLPRMSPAVTTVGTDKAGPRGQTLDLPGFFLDVRLARPLLHC